MEEIPESFHCTLKMHTRRCMQTQLTVGEFPEPSERLRVVYIDLAVSQHYRLLTSIV